MATCIKCNESFIPLKSRLVCGRRTPAVVMCRCCGSMTIKAKTSVQQENQFCDVDCANEYKKWHNKKDEYKARWATSRKGSQFGARIADRAQTVVSQAELQESLYKGWKCCAFCDKAVCSRGPCCSETCRRELAKAKRRAVTYHDSSVIAAQCKHCMELFTYKRMFGYTPRLFCSDRCSKRFFKHLRRHLARSKGYVEQISLVALAKKNKMRCKICSCICVMPKGNNLDSEATLDHVQPLSKGGSHIWANVQLLCRRCNTQKSDKVAEGTQLMLTYG